MYKLSAWFITPLVSVLFLVVCVFLPHDPYVRFQSLDVGVYQKAQWIYERIVFDETPIDVAFLGTSHTLNGIDSEIIEESLASMDKRVTNLAIPHFGRDMHNTLGTLLLENKKPEVLIIEIRELEARDLHPGTHYLAEHWDLFTSEKILNLRYFDNLAHLPLRQVSLFMQTYFPSLFDVAPGFDESAYAGSHVNYTMVWPNGKLRDKVMPEEVIINRHQKHEKNNKSKNTEIGSVKDYLFYNANRVHLTQLVEKAQKQGVEVFFLYLPGYSAPLKPYHEEFYLALAPIIYINDEQIFKSHQNWLDLGHLNADGARMYSKRLSDWLIGFMSEDDKELLATKK